MEKRRAETVDQPVARERNQFDTPFFEFLFQFNYFSHLGSANGCEVPRMSKEHSPRVAQPFMEFDGAHSGLRAEVRKDNAQYWWHFFSISEVNVRI